MQQQTKTVRIAFQSELGELVAVHYGSRATALYTTIGDDHVVVPLRDDDQIWVERAGASVPPGRWTAPSRVRRVTAQGGEDASAPPWAVEVVWAPSDAMAARAGRRYAGAAVTPQITVGADRQVRTWPNVWAFAGRLDPANSLEQVLGESGRARSQCRLLSYAGATAPAPGSPVAAVAVGCDAVRFVDGASPGPHPLYLIARTHGGYRRDNVGDVSVFGDGAIVATGRWADGDAGNLGRGIDALVACTGPACVFILRTPFARTLVLTDPARNKIQAFSLADLREALLRDDEGWIREVIEAVRPALPERWHGLELPQVLAEIDAADALLAKSADPAEGVAHVGLELAGRSGLRLLVPRLTTAGDPPGAPSCSHGLDVVDGALVPGPHALVFHVTTPGGGRRWSASAPSWSGLELVHERNEIRVFRVVSPDWSIEYVQSRDGLPQARQGQSARGATIDWAIDPAGP